MIAVTAIYASLIALLFIVLSARVIVYRRAHRKGLGDQGDPSLLKRMRAQANCAEYAPIGLILLGIAELNGAPAVALHLLGATLLAGRVMHGYGFSASPPLMALRVGGMGLTLFMIGLTALGLLAHAVMR